MKNIITKFFTKVAMVACLATVFAGSAWATDIVVTLDNIGAGLSSTANTTATTTDITATGTSDTYTLNYYQCKKQGSAMLMTKSVDPFISNHTAMPGNIKSVEVFINSGASGKTTYDCAFSTKECTSATTGIGAVNITGGNSHTFSNLSGTTINVAGKYFCVTLGNANNGQVLKLVITCESTGGSSLTTSDLVITGAPVALNFDLYNNTTAQTVTYTTSSTGTVTVSGGSSYVTTTHNSGTKTISVTPTAVTPSAQTITISQAADATYAAGTATFTVSVADSTPFTGGDVEFDATRESGTSPLSKNGVSFTCSNGALNNGSEYRLYKNSTTTFSVSTGVISSIVFTGTSGNPASGFTSQDGWTTNGNNGTWTGTAQSVSFVASGAQVRATKIVVTYDPNATPTPSISADNVSIAYDASSGEISYTISNPTSETLSASSTADWISNFVVSDTKVTFTTTANTGNARTATVTLTYGTVTKNVTVTQESAPVIYSTIPDLFAAATSTETEVHVTFNSWVVSGVSTNGKNVFITDNSCNGFVIFDNNGGLGNTYSVGDILSGTDVTCNLVLYNGFAEIKSLDASDLTITSGGTITAANIALANLDGVNTGSLVNYKNLLCSVDNSKYYLSDGTTTLQVYNALYAFDALESGKYYDITGIYQQYNSTKEILPRSAADIEEVVVTTPTITVTPATVNKTASDVDGTMDIIYANLTITDMSDFEVKFCNAQGTVLTSGNEPTWILADVAEQDPNIGTGYVVSIVMDANTGDERTAYIIVYALDDNANDVYSNLVTITQAAYVPDYASLPFNFTGGKSDIDTTLGLTHNGLGSDYSSAPKLKFDTTGDYVILKINETPGVLSFDIKGNGSSSDPWSGTFTVQTSANGVTYTDLATYTELGSTQHEEFSNLTTNVRYIKWIYTEKVLGNVALGNISLTAAEAAPATINLAASTVGNGFWVSFYNGEGRYNLPAGAQAFTMNSEYKLYRLGDGDVIPQGVAVIIIADKANITLTKSDETGSVAVSGGANILQGADSAVTKESGKTYYVLGLKSGAIDFYKYTGTSVPAGRAYYTVNNE